MSISINEQNKKQTQDKVHKTPITTISSKKRLKIPFAENDGKAQ